MASNVVHPQLALGVLSAPRASIRRAAARNTWLRDAAVLSGRVAVRFVLGSLGSSNGAKISDACAEAAAAAAASHGDVLLVATLDCQLWHSPAKVHAWFHAALEAYPHTPWLGKTEDDALPWPTAILVDVGALSPAVDYYGIMSWQGSCRMHGGHDVDCAGCYGGPLSIGVSICRPATCRAVHASLVAPSGRKQCCQVGCPRAVRMTPFALGALDLRRRTLASTVDQCEYAAAYFSAVSAHGERRHAMCTTTDGAQGHVIGECVKSLTLADAGSRRLLDGSLCRPGGGRCASGSVAVLHPLKRVDSASWGPSWRALSQQREYTPSPLYEAALPNLAARPNAGAVPRLQLLSERFGPFGLEAHGNGSLAHAWAMREQYAHSVTSRSRRVPAGRALAGSAGARVSVVDRPGALAAAMRPREAMMPLRGRRLKSEPAWAINCSRLWGTPEGRN